MLDKPNSYKQYFVSENTAAISYISSEPFIESETEIKPFVKWAGGKRQLLSVLRMVYPKELGETITKYVEPFVGGGAVLFDILKLYNLKEIYIYDINSELINTYTIIRDNCQELIYKLSDLREKYWDMEERGDEEKKAFYYECRNRYNLLKKTEEGGIELAALFVFLNKTCYNGLYRVNKKGGFNVPIGSYKYPQIFNAESLENISKALNGVEIICSDYHNSLDVIDENTFVYIDPPYRPLTTSANFTSYSENEFDDDAQKGLAEFVKVINAKGAKILLSNSDPKNVNPNDNFFDELYADFTIERVRAARMINSNAKKRGNITEILVSNYKRS